MINSAAFLSDALGSVVTFWNRVLLQHPVKLHEACLLKLIQLSWGSSAAQRLMAALVAPLVGKLISLLHRYCTFVTYLPSARDKGDSFTLHTGKDETVAWSKRGDIRHGGRWLTIEPQTQKLIQTIPMKALCWSVNFDPLVVNVSEAVRVCFLRIKN